MLKTMLVWTMGYFPFVMGGKVWQPIGTNVEVSQAIPVGRGYKVYVVTAPNGKVFIAEATTGAFVGPSIESVKKDIETGDPKLMKEQVKKATATRENVKVLEPTDFWTRLKCAGKPKR